MIGLLGYLALATRLQWDVTRDSHNSLSQANNVTFKKLAGSVDITVSTDQHVKFDEMSYIISIFVALYRNIKQDITATFRDPVAQQASARVNGKVVVNYKGGISFGNNQRAGNDPFVYAAGPR